jgi:hypothetical protein
MPEARPQTQILLSSGKTLNVVETREEAVAAIVGSSYGEFTLVTGARATVLSPHVVAVFDYGRADGM